MILIAETFASLAVVTAAEGVTDREAFADVLARAMVAEGLRRHERLVQTTSLPCDIGLIQWPVGQGYEGLSRLVQRALPHREADSVFAASRDAPAWALRPSCLCPPWRWARWRADIGLSVSCICQQGCRNVPPCTCTLGNPCARFIWQTDIDIRLDRRMAQVAAQLGVTLEHPESPQPRGPGAPLVCNRS